MSSNGENKMSENRPWLKFYDQIPQTIDYPRVSLYERVVQTVEKHPDAIAWDFMGNTSTYRKILFLHIQFTPHSRQ